MVGSYTENYPNHRNSQNRGLGACSGMGACSGLYGMMDVEFVVTSICMTQVSLEEIYPKIGLQNPSDTFASRLT